MPLFLCIIFSGRGSESLAPIDIIRKMDRAHHTCTPEELNLTNHSIHQWQDAPKYQNHSMVDNCQTHSSIVGKTPRFRYIYDSGDQLISTLMNNERSNAQEISWRNKKNTLVRLYNYIEVWRDKARATLIFRNILCGSLKNSSSADL